MAHFDIENLSFAYPEMPWSGAGVGPSQKDGSSRQDGAARRADSSRQAHSSRQAGSSRRGDVARGGGRRGALDGVTLSLERGSYTVICGRSGCGKTTLLRHLKPVLAPHGAREGRVLFDGAPVERLGLRDQAVRIGFVMQSPSDQVVCDKVWHELAFGLENVGCDPQVMRSRVAETASYFGIQGWFERDVSELSGGQLQLLNLASVMVMQPEALILDEPTGQLDPIAAMAFLNAVERINRELGTTVVISEHRLEEVCPVADRLVVLEGGRVAAEGTPREVAAALHSGGNGMLASMPAAARVFYGTGGATVETGGATCGEGGKGAPAEGASEKGATIEVCPVAVREGKAWLERSFPERVEAVRRQAGHDALDDMLASDAPAGGTPSAETPSAGDAPAAPAGPLALRIRDAWFRYEKNGDDVLKGLDLDVPRGCFLALLGGNGTGKTTLLKIACGVYAPYRGGVEVFGERPGRRARAAGAPNRAAMLPQDPRTLFVKRTVREDLAEMGADAETLRAAVDACEVAGLMGAHPWDLSGGEQQRVALAKVLLARPRLLLLDEPTKGMDGLFKERFARLVRDLAAGGTTVVAASHDVEFCAEHADLVALMFGGGVATAGDARRVFGTNRFYTTAASRMSRTVFPGAVTVPELVERVREAHARGKGRP